VGPFLFFLGLRNGKRRFAELRREIRGVTEKMLIQTLRNLERPTELSHERSIPRFHQEWNTAYPSWAGSLAPILDAIHRLVIANVL